MSTRRNKGFTLIELMVVLVVMVVTLLIALPSFTAFNHRQKVRGAADGVLSVWNDARFEAAKRNVNVKFGYRTSGSDFCVGAATTTNPNDTTPCDCTSATPSSDTCDVSRYPAAQGEWNGVTLNSGSTLGGANHVVVFDLKQLRLVDASGAGAISLDDPAGSKNYRLNVRVDKFGRGVICHSTASGLDPMPGFDYRRCSP